jgi:hypothetical protein
MQDKIMKSAAEMPRKIESKPQVGALSADSSQAQAMKRVLIDAHS